MDIVLDGGDSPSGGHKVMEKRLRRRSSGSDSNNTNVRRSSRIRSSHQAVQSQADSHQKTRRRYNSVMDDQNDDEEDMEEDIENQEPKRREPEHRQLNRMRLQRQNVSPELSPEDRPTFTEEINKEKTLVEILLRKYGFGHWKLPNEESKDNNIYPSYLEPTK